MSFKCSIGLHTWDHCVCTKCGKKRNEQHALNEDCEKCSICGATFENQHNWSRDCQQCSKCGKKRDVEHLWKNNCEKCSKCSVTRSNMHQMVNGICQVCGHGSFTDADGKEYKTIKVGNSVIMAENYVRIPGEGRHWAYDNDDKNVVKNGYLYDYETAVKIAPKGWHLPTKDEWENALKTLGDNGKEIFEHIKAGGTSGFDSTFSGWRNARGAFNSLGASAHFWTSTKDGEKEAWHLNVSAYKAEAKMEKSDKHLGYSVRYFRD